MDSIFINIKQYKNNNIKNENPQRNFEIPLKLIQNWRNGKNVVNQFVNDDSTVASILVASSRGMRSSNSS